MNTTEILTKIKTLLGVESEVVRLAQMKLDDGLTIVESENFAAGDEIVIITEDGKVALPVGEYTLEDKRVLVVSEEGIIAEVKEEKKEEEVEEVVEPEEEVEAKEETTTPKKVVESVTKESYFSEIEKLQKENESLKKEMEDLKLKAVENTNKEEETKEVTSEVELKEVEETKPIVHNPENKERVNLGRKISPNKQRTIMDSVFEKIANKNN
jgi:hypothetical protein